MTGQMGQTGGHNRQMVVCVNRPPATQLSTDRPPVYVYVCVYNSYPFMFMFVMAIRLQPTGADDPSYVQWCRLVSAKRLPWRDL